MYIFAKLEKGVNLHPFANPETKTFGKKCLKLFWFVALWLLQLQNWLNAQIYPYCDLYHC